MPKHSLLSFTSLALSVFILIWSVPVYGVTASTTVPRKGDIKNAAARVGNRWIKKNPCPAGTCTLNNTWDRGVLMAGIIEHWRKHGTVTYKTYAENWANVNDWLLISVSNEIGNWHNRMTAAYTYLRLLQAGSSGASVADVTSNLDRQLSLPIFPECAGMVAYKFPGTTRCSRSWKTVDAEFLALPIWITMGKQMSKIAYYDRVRDLQDYQVNVMGLQDPATKLWYRDETYKTALSPNGRPVIWGRGTGWIAAALAIALEELPTFRSEYVTYQSRFIDLMKAVSTRQRADGFWNMNITDPNHYPSPETSATALITYAMAKGITLGVLSSATYTPVVAKAWNAMVGTSIRNDGFLGYCQGEAKEPHPPGHKNYPDCDNSSDFCVGAFLLAGTAMYDLSTTTGTSPVIKYEAESMTTAVSAGDSQADVGRNNYASASFSNKATLNGANDYVQYTASNVPEGTYSLRVRFRKSTDMAKWQLSAGGTNLGDVTDGYDVNPHFAEVEVGKVTYLSTANRTYRFTVASKNSASSSYNIQIDTIKFVTL